VPFIATNNMSSKHYMSHLFFIMFSTPISMATVSILLFTVIIFYIDVEIKPIETVSWSVEKLKHMDKSQYFIIPSILFLIAFPMTITVNYFRETSWHSGTPRVLVVLGILGLVCLLQEGLENKIPHERTRINQGIIASFHNTLRYGIPWGLVLGLVFWLALFEIGQTELTFKSFIYFFIISVLILSISLGGDACLKHYLLRLLLWLERLTPFNYTRFLDYAARLILLRKVGGGYVFIHRVLLEHFAVKAR
jgi:hypothetical protein